MASAGVLLGSLTWLAIDVRNLIQVMVVCEGFRRSGLCMFNACHGNCVLGNLHCVRTLCSPNYRSGNSSLAQWHRI